MPDKNRLTADIEKTTSSRRSRAQKDGSSNAGDAEQALPPQRIYFDWLQQKYGIQPDFCICDTAADSAARDCREEERDALLPLYPESFADKLVLRAFGQSPCLTPALCGDPWLLRDKDHARLARVVKLFDRYRDSLQNTMPLPEDIYGAQAVAHSDGRTCLLTLRNDGWHTKRLTVTLQEPLLAETCEQVFVASHHPYEYVYGVFPYGACVEIEIPAHRVFLLAVCDEPLQPPMFKGWQYKVMQEDERGVPYHIEPVTCEGIITKPDGSVHTLPAFDLRIREPILLGRTAPTELTDARRKLETAYYAADTDAPEARLRKRSGKTGIPAIQAARDAFFTQKAYLLCGPEYRVVFDKLSEAFYDGMSKSCLGGLRLLGGCLRVNFKRAVDADEVLVDFFEPKHPDGNGSGIRSGNEYAEISTNLADWTKTGLGQKTVLVEEETMEVPAPDGNGIETICGSRVRIRYPVDVPVQYFALDCPPDRLYSIVPRKNGKSLRLRLPFANNLFPSFSRMQPKHQQSAVISLRSTLCRKDCFLAVSIEGTHGDDGVWAVVECEENLYGAPERFVPFRANPFTRPVRGADAGYTFFFPVRREWVGMRLTVHILGMNERTDWSAVVRLLDARY